jgi:hypothetical protein
MTDLLQENFNKCLFEIGLIVQSIQSGQKMNARENKSCVYYIREEMKKEIYLTGAVDFKQPVSWPVI